MLVVTVTFGIKPGRMRDFLPLMKENAQRSIAAEPGCLRFDVCLPGDTTDEVFLYESYTSGLAFEDHKKTRHFPAFDRATGPVVARKTVRQLSLVGGEA